MSELRFAEPHFVHLLWAVLAFVVALLLLERRSRGALDSLVGPALRARLVRTPAGWRRMTRVALFGLTGVFLVLALMRPQAGLRQIETPQVGAELMIALDVSRSMLAEDAVPNRLERARAEIVDLLGYLEGDQVGLIAFAGRAAVLCPLTPDFGFLRLVLESTGPGSVGRGGSRLSEPIRMALEGFGPAIGASRAILLITDGDDHDSFALDAAREAAEAGVRIIAIGFGDENGSEIHVTNPRTGARELVRDADGTPVRSRLDGALLRELAWVTDGAYIPAATGVLDLESIYDTHIAGLTRSKLEARSRTVRDEVYGWFVLAALVCLVASVGVASGPTLAGMLVLALLLPPAPPASAAPVGSPSVADSPAAEESAEPETEAEPAGDRTPRERYNAGVEALSAGDLERAEHDLQQALGEAGDDAELRFRASYDLGFLVAQRAGRVEAEQPDAALADLHRAADWFREALALQPEHEDARINLEVTLRRALLLADRLAREREGGLEGELGALAKRQREIADEVVRLHALSAAAPSPDAGERLRDEYRSAATSERVLLSDADGLALRSADEQAALEDIPEPDRSSEDAARSAQLAGVLHYLHRARERMGQTRRQLRERQGERAYRRAAAVVEELERAVDQLRDPVRVLDRLLRAQGEVSQQTALLAADGRGLLGAPDAPRPAWLGGEAIAERQASVTERVMELGLRLRAGLEGNAEVADPGQAALLESVGEAVPLVEAAHDALREAYTALDGGEPAGATPAQQVALASLAAARELFLDVKGLIEAAHGEQAQLGALLGEAEAEALREALAPMREAQARNLGRVERLAGLLAREREQVLAASQSEAQAGPAPGAEDPALQRLDLAAELLPLVDGAMRDVEVALGAAGGPAEGARFGAALGATRDAHKYLGILRRLFFSIVEEVRDVAEQQLALQDDTRDLEAAQAAGDAEAEALEPVLERQAGLAERALALANAMAEQASQAGAQGDPAAAESADTLRLAGEHVLTAEGAMRAVAPAVGADPADFEAARTRQDEALTALAEALALLTPPQQQRQEQQDPDAGEGESQPEPQPSQAEGPREPQADPAQLLQGVRDREAQRRRERARRGVAEDTVERDW